MKIWKYSGHMMFWTGIIHNTIGVFMGWEILKDIFNAGIINSLQEDMPRNAIFWFLFSGFFMMMFGTLLQSGIRIHDRPVEAKYGYYLLALAIIGCLMMPVSGFWIVLPQALIIIMGSAGTRKTVMS